jgi:antagonist of KipI
MIKVLAPGLQSSIQDTTPRNGIEYGISNGGTADSRAATLGNIILGQHESCPVLEIVRSPVKFQFMEACTIAITGFGMDWKLKDDKKVEPWKVQHLPKNSVLIGRPTATGFRSYICFQGGFKADLFDETYGTDLRLGLGGSQRALKKEDILIVNDDASSSNLCASRAENHDESSRLVTQDKFNSNSSLDTSDESRQSSISVTGNTPKQKSLSAEHPQAQPTSEEKNFKSGTWRISHDLTAYASQKTIRIMPGPEISWFDHGAVHRFMKSSWKIDSKSDRMGIRLKNDFSLPMPSEEMLSTVVIPGTIQITSSGPIILFADAQTTGGYPRIGQVCAVDLPVLAQKTPGNEILFEWITPEQAIRLQDAAHREIQQIKSAISLH